MDQGKQKKILLGIVLFLVITACSVSGSDSNTPVTPTPNLTLTEWFRPTAASATESPTATTAPQETQADQPDETPADIEATPTIQTGTENSPQSGIATLIPAETLTPISLSGPNNEIMLVAEYLDDVPAIDGDTGDWSSQVYALDKIVKGNEFYANELDLSGDFKLGWDMEYLYVGVTVRDTQFVQTASGAQLGQGDSLEVLIDTQWQADISDDELSADDFQLGFSPGNLKEVSIPEGYLWAPINTAGPLTMGQVAGRLTNDGYMIEVAIAWEELDMTPSSDLTLGFLLSVADNDSVNRIEQQSVLSFASERALSNPTTWATLALINP